MLHRRNEHGAKDESIKSEIAIDVTGAAGKRYSEEDVIDGETSV